MEPSTYRYNDQRSKISGKFASGLFSIRVKHYDPATKAELHTLSKIKNADYVAIGYGRRNA